MPRRSSLRPAVTFDQTECYLTNTSSPDPLLYPPQTSIKSPDLFCHPRAARELCSRLGGNEGGGFGGLSDMLEGLERALGEATVAVGQTAVGDAAKAGVVVLASHALTDLSEVLAGPTGEGAVALLVDLGPVAFDATRDCALDLLASPTWAANILLV